MKDHPDIWDGKYVIEQESMVKFLEGDKGGLKKEENGATEKLDLIQTFANDPNVKGLLNYCKQESEDEDSDGSDGSDSDDD